MPVPLSGLAKNFKAIDVTTNGNANTYLETSSSTTSISSPSNYMRPQGLNNSNSSTMSSRSKLVSNSSSSVNSSAGIKNFQHISSGSYSKLKSKFNKENTNSSPSSVMNHNHNNNNNNNMHTPESKSIIDSSSQNFSNIKESFKNLERSESQTLLNARNSNYKTVTSTVPCSKQTQYLTMPLKKSRNTNSNNNFRAMIDTMEPLTPTIAPTVQNKRHDSSEAESSSSLLLSLSSMSSYASLKENCKQTSSKSSSSTSSCENEPSMASVSDKIKKLSNETSSSTLKYNQQEHTLKKRTSAYSSTSSLAVKSSKHLEETNGICSNHSMSSVSVFNSDTSSSPSSTSPNSNKAQVSRVYLKEKVLMQRAVQILNTDCYSLSRLFIVFLINPGRPIKIDQLISIL